MYGKIRSAIAATGVGRATDVGSPRLMVSGVGPRNPITAHFFETPGFTIRKGYGMSENGPLITTNKVEYYDNSSIGLPVKYTDIRIIEPDRGGVGHIEVRSPSRMKGYHNNEEATREIMTEVGYLRMDDPGLFDREGYLHIAGRNMNLIVTGGGKRVPGRN